LGNLFIGVGVRQDYTNREGGGRMGRIAETWDEVKSYSDDLIVLFVLGAVIKEYVVPILTSLLS